MVLSNWRQMDTEHIILSGSWQLINLTVACHGYNRAKSNWNPVTGLRGFNPITDGPAVPPDEAERQRLIEVSRQYVQSRWNSGAYAAEIHARQLADGRSVCHIVS